MLDCYVNIQYKKFLQIPIYFDEFCKNMQYYILKNKDGSRDAET